MSPKRVGSYISYNDKYKRRDNAMCTPTRDEIQCTFNGVLHMYTIEIELSSFNNTYIRHTDRGGNGAP